MQKTLACNHQVTNYGIFITYCCLAHPMSYLLGRGKYKCSLVPNTSNFIVEDLNLKINIGLPGPGPMELLFCY